METGLSHHKHLPRCCQITMTHSNEHPAESLLRIPHSFEFPLALQYDMDGSGRLSRQEATRFCLDVVQRLQQLHR